MIDLRKSKGFTLLEVLIVLVILAVVAGLAIPGYNAAVERSRTQEAIATLSAVRSAEQRYYAGFSTYTNNFDLLDYDPMDAVVGNVRNYDYTIDTADAANLLVTATRNANNNPGSLSYTVTINQDGVIVNNM